MYRVHELVYSGKLKYFCHMNCEKLTWLFILVRLTSLIIFIEKVSVLCCKRTTRKWPMWVSIPIHVTFSRTSRCRTFYRIFVHCQNWIKRVWKTLWRQTNLLSTFSNSQKLFLFDNRSANEGPDGLRWTRLNMNKLE